MPTSTHARSLGDKLLALSRQLYPDWTHTSLNEDFEKFLIELKLTNPHDAVTTVRLNQWLEPGLTEFNLHARSRKLIESWIEKTLGFRVRIEWFDCGLTDADKHIIRNQKTFGVWKLDCLAFHRLRALEGTYQIIRPYNQTDDRFVLETMMIAPSQDDGSGPKNLWMYSHNERKADKLYEGQLLAGDRFSFGMLQRDHESRPGDYAYRCLSLYVDSKTSGAKFLERYSLSGIILRGVAAKTGGIAKNAIGVSFLAIRPKSTSCDLRKPNFRSAGIRLASLGDGFLVGVLHDYMAPNLFAFCKQRFDTIKKKLPDQQKEFVLHTVTPLEVEIAFQSTTSDDDSPFQKWREAVRQELPDAI